MVTNSLTDNNNPIDTTFLNPTDDSEKITGNVVSLNNGLRMSQNTKTENKEGKIMSSEDYNHLLSEIKDIKTENKITNARIDNTNKIIAIVGGLIGIVLTVFIFACNTQYIAIKDMNNANMQAIQTEIKALNQRLDYQEKLNKLDIENQVQTEVKNYLKK